MWRCEDVKMWGCEDEKMRRCEDVRMRRCEDVSMWRWEDVKMRRCFTDPHYWKNPAFRRSREKGKIGRHAVRKMSLKLKETEMPVPLRENVCKASMACPSVRSRVQDLLCGHKIFARGKLKAPTCSHMPLMLRSSLSSYRSITYTSAFPTASHTCSRQRWQALIVRKSVKSNGGVAILCRESCALNEVSRISSGSGQLIHSVLHGGQRDTNVLSMYRNHSDADFSHFAWSCVDHQPPSFARLDPCLRCQCKGISWTLVLTNILRVDPQ